MLLAGKWIQWICASSGGLVKIFSDMTAFTGALIRMGSRTLADDVLGSNLLNSIYEASLPKETASLSSSLGRSSACCVAFTFRSFQLWIHGSFISAIELNSLCWCRLYRSFQSVSSCSKPLLIKNSRYPASSDVSWRRFLITSRAASKASVEEASISFSANWTFLGSSLLVRCESCDSAAGGGPSWIESGILYEEKGHSNLSLSRMDRSSIYFQQIEAEDEKRLRRWRSTRFEATLVAYIGASARWGQALAPTVALENRACPFREIFSWTAFFFYFWCFSRSKSLLFSWMGLGLRRQVFRFEVLRSAKYPSFWWGSGRAMASCSRGKGAYQIFAGVSEFQIANKCCSRLMSVKKFVVEERNAKEIYFEYSRTCYS